MKYLVIRFSSFGDCVLLCPLLASMAENAADEISVVTKQSFAGLFRAVRGVKEVFCLENGSKPRDLYRLAASLRPARYQVIDAHNTIRSRIFTRFLGARSIRFQKYYRARLELILFKRQTPLPSMLQRYAYLAPTAGAVPTPQDRTVLEITAEVDRSLPPEVPGSDRPFVALAPGSRWPAKRWGTDRYRALAHNINKRFGLRVLLLGDGHDRETSGAVARALGDGAVDLTGRTSIVQAAACLARARALVTNDSGLMHLAEAVGTPVLGLFGPTVEAFGYYPSLPASKTCERRLSCRPCSRNGARACLMGTRECLSGIDPAAVSEIFADLLAGTGPRRYVLP